MKFNPTALMKAYERWYPIIATAIIASLLTAIVAFSPIGAKIRGQIAGVTEPDEATGAGFMARVANDWGFWPNRFLHADGVADISKYQQIDTEFSARRKGRPLLYSRDKARDDYILVVGAFEFPEGLHGALLIDRAGNVVKRWPIPPHGGHQGAMREDYRVFPHGFALASDGSAVIAFDNGGRLIRIDRCGNLLWRKDGPYHHVVIPDPENAGEIWTWHAISATRMRAEDGKELESVRMRKVEETNPTLDIFGVRERDKFGQSIPDSDAQHFNDFEPLPVALADKFPMFNAGDLLVSARSLNLVFVVDRKTKKVKWQASSYWRRQHDPDWGNDGRIYVFNNNMNRGPSSIVAIDPATNRTETVIDGAKINFYSNIRGKQSWSADGRVIFVSPMQGRVVEIDDKGEISLDLLNRYEADGGPSLVISEAMSVAKDFLQPSALLPCAP